MEKGVLLLAGGNPHYGRMAFNLLLGLKAVDSSVKVALAHDEPGAAYLTESEHALFDACASIDPALYRDGSAAHWGRLKCQLPALSPFQTTLFLDVDTVWFPLKPVSALFNALSTVDFTAQHSGAIPQDAPAQTRIECWADVGDVRKSYDLAGPMYLTHSYFFYFQKTERALRFFQTASDVCDDLLARKFPFLSWQNTVPDELCFAVATGLLGESFPNDEYKPVYEYTNPRPPTRNELFNRFYAATQCGNRSPAGWRALYNDLNAHYHRFFKRPLPYQWKDKYRF